MGQRAPHPCGPRHTHLPAGPRITKGPARTKPLLAVSPSPSAGHVVGTHPASAPGPGPPPDPHGHLPNVEDDTDESRPSLLPELLEVLMVLRYRFFGISNSVYLPSVRQHKPRTSHVPLHRGRAALSSVR